MGINVYIRAKYAEDYRRQPKLIRADYKEYLYSTHKLVTIENAT